MLNNIKQIKKIKLRNLKDENEVLSFIESEEDIPFKIKRIFYITGISKDRIRGKHAHRQCSQFLISIKGSINVNCEDGNKKYVYKLNNPYEGLFIPPLIWSEQTYQSEESILLALCDYEYDENEYIRDYDSFIKETNYT